MLRNFFHRCVCVYVCVCLTWLCPSPPPVPYLIPSVRCFEGLYRKGRFLAWPFLLLLQCGILLHLRGFIDLISVS